MRLTRKDFVKAPCISNTGEQVFEMIGAPIELGKALYHSFGHVVIPKNCSSRKHSHPIAEETYYILKGLAQMVVDDKDYHLTPGDAILIQQNEKHQIFCEGDCDLEFIVVCAPAWTPDNSIYYDEE